MPKLTWMNRPNYLAALWKAYRQATGITTDEMAEALGCSPENVRSQINKAAAKWNVEQIMRWCDVLGIQYQEAFEAAVKSRPPAGRRESGSHK